MNKYSPFIQTWLTARDTPEARLTRQPDLPLLPETEECNMPSITLKERVTYQAIEGFGGAFTESAALVWNLLPPAKRDALLAAYFHPTEGLGYTFCRTHLNSCDFSNNNFAHCESEEDWKAGRFSMERHRQSIFPMIQAAQQIAKEPIKLLVSPWSPPAWMKTNGKMNHGGQLKPEYRDAWAHYFARFIHTCTAENIPVWAVTVQNEPEAVQRWDSCVYSGREERDFVRDHLGPVLEQEGLGYVKIVIWDHNRDELFRRAEAVLDDPEAARFVWGVGFHWYVQDCFQNVQLVRDAWPEKALVFTEGCQEGGPHIGSWLTGERYARSIVQDLNHGTCAWIDWNLTLDMRGGPNHVGNYCSAPILADPQSAQLHYQSSYFYIGHFSRFIRPGAHRILAASSRDDIETTAFLNPDNSVVVVILNRSENRVSLRLRLARQVAQIVAPPRSIQTVVIR